MLMFGSKQFGGPNLVFLDKDKWACPQEFGVVISVKLKGNSIRIRHTLPMNRDPIQKIANDKKGSFGISLRYYSVQPLRLPIP